MKRYREQITNPDGAKYLGFAKSKLRTLEYTRKNVGPPHIPRHDWFLVDGFLIFVKSSNEEDVIRITGGLEGFVFHPRSDTNPYGLEPNGTPLPLNDYSFPLVDNDHGSRMFSKSRTGWDYVVPPENYGNLAWFDEHGKRIVSWKGPPGVTIEMDPVQTVAGLTAEDDTIGGVTRYTAFRGSAYSKGLARFVLPSWGSATPKVLCAGYDYLNRLIVLAGTNYLDVANPDGGTGGFYDELVVVGKDWTRLHVRRSSRHTLPAFLSIDGTTIVSQFGVYAIHEDDATFTAHTDAEAGYKQYSSSDWGVLFSSVKNTAFHLAGSLLLSFSGTDQSTIVSDSTENTTSVPLYASVDDPGWVTLSEDIAGCGCASSLGPGYIYYDDGYRDIVYWRVTEIPSDAMTFADVVAWMQVGSVEEGDGCSWGPVTRPIYISNLWDLVYAGKWIVFPEGYASHISQCHVSNNYEPPNWDPRSPGWFKINDNPSYDYRMGGPYTGASNYYYCGKAPKEPYFGFSASGPTRICSDYLSDTYKVGVTDIYGATSIDIPDSSGGYLVKVCRVVHQRCTAL